MIRHAPRHNLPTYPNRKARLAALAPHHGAPRVAPTGWRRYQSEGHWQLEAQLEGDPELAVEVQDDLHLQDGYLDATMSSDELHPDLYGWWRITETSQWDDDDLGTAVISITGHDDRLRMPHLLVVRADQRGGLGFTGEPLQWPAWHGSQCAPAAHARTVPALTAEMFCGPPIPSNISLQFLG
jgi:hypothetical protein